MVSSATCVRSTWCAVSHPACCRRRQLDLRQNIMHAATRPATARTMRPYAPASTAVARAVASDGETRAHPGVGGRHSRAGMSRWRRDLFRRTNPAPRPTSSSAGSSAMRQCVWLLLLRYQHGVSLTLLPGSQTWPACTLAAEGAARVRMRESQKGALLCVAVLWWLRALCDVVFVGRLSLTEEQVARLPRTRVAAPTARPATAPAHDLAPQHGQRGESAQAACCICLQQMASGDEATALPCLHLFHFKVWCAWVRGHVLLCVWLTCELYSVWPNGFSGSPCVLYVWPQ